MAFIALHWSISDGNKSQFKVPEQHIVQNSWFCIVELSCMSVIDVFNPQACGTCLIRVRKKSLNQKKIPIPPSSCLIWREKISSSSVLMALHCHLQWVFIYKKIEFRLIGRENSYKILNQLDGKIKRIMTGSLAFLALSAVYRGLF